MGKGTSLACIFFAKRSRMAFGSGNTGEAGDNPEPVKNKCFGLKCGGLLTRPDYVDKTTFPWVPR